MVNKWTVYRHISPSGKVYIGITSKENVNKRQRYGTGYSSCIIFQNTINKYDLDMNFIAEFPSISYASKVTGLTLSRITECCRGKTNKYKNYYWRYKDGK